APHGGRPRTANSPITSRTSPSRGAAVCDFAGALGACLVLWHAQCFVLLLEIPLMVPEERASLLIIDDDRGPAESLRMVFKEQYEVFTAPGGKEALEVLRDRPIDVVTLDLRMPGMTGNEV